MKDDRINIRIPAQMKEIWCEAADGAGLSLSNWIIYRCNHPLPIVRTEHENVRTPFEQNQVVSMGKVPFSHGVDTTTTSYQRKHHPRCQCDVCKDNK